MNRPHPNRPERVFGEFQTHMWSILGQSTLDALRNIDWAIKEHGVSPDVVAGGVSMGGDISVALAGVDQRVTRVAAITATPDWTRPGMREIGGSTAVIDQGQADTYAQWFYSHIDPAHPPVGVRARPRDRLRVRRRRHACSR